MRQAVIIIHGVGEQRPMQTLRSFVAGVLGLTKVEELKDQAFSKPDRISDTLELRRLSVPGGYGGQYKLDRNCETDFYELYWQHLIQGTTWRSVLNRVLYWLYHPRKLNKRWLRIWWRLFWFVAIALLAAIALWALELEPSGAKPVAWEAEPDWPAPSTVILSVLLGGIGLWFVSGVLQWIGLGYVGDAVRYLNPAPPNVAARRAIRTAGLTLLRGLHEDELRRYERIVLVGHSLGSVIAYDLITWFWQEQHHRVEVDDGSGQQKTVLTHPVKASASDCGRSPLEESSQGVCVDALQEIQWDAWQEHRKERGLPWLITDLVTLGSPLAHADMLLADGKDNLKVGKCQREFPTCPPMPEDRRDDGLLCREYAEGGLTRQVRILHHGAPFAVTRWTNLFFSGDILGGRVSDLLGEGIKDIELTNGKIVPGWRSHTRYWDMGEEEACIKLREALCLNQANTPHDVPLPSRS